MVMLAVAAMDHEKLLKPSFGINFRPIGELQPTTNYYYVTLEVPLPTRLMKVIEDFQTRALDCNIDETDDYTKHVCSDFQPVFLELQLRAEQLKAELTETITSIRSIHPKTKQTNKRALPLMILGGFFTGGFRLLSSILQYKRTNSLKKSLKVLADDHYRLKDQFIDFSKDLTSISKLHSEAISKMAEKVNRTNKRIDSLVKSVQIQFSLVSEKYSDLERKARAITILSQLTSQLFLYSDRTITSFNQLLSYSKNILRSITEMMDGSIPTSLISPDKLAKILNHATDILYKSNTDYVLTFDSLEQYYRLKNTGFTINNENLIINLALPIRPEYQRAMKLYKIETTYVPTDTTDKRQSRSYTKLILKPEYIAVFENNFVELTDNTLRFCTSYESTYLCEQTILQIHKSQMTCPVAILWEADIESIKALCEFEYFHELSPTPEILDAGDRLLLAHLSRPWQLMCDGSSVPVRHEGSDYAILMKNNLCNCQLSSDSDFIEAQLGACDSESHKFTLNYTFNGAMATYFRHIEGFHTLNIDVHKLYNTIPNISLPNLNVIHKHELDVAETDAEIPVKLQQLADIVEHKRALYLSSEDKIESELKFENWFSSSNKAIGVMFICSILGSFAMIITIYVCIKSHKFATLVGAFINAPVAQGLTLDVNSNDVMCTDNTLLTRIFVHLCITITLFLLFQLIKEQYKQSFVMKVLVPTSETKTKRECTMLIELIANNEYLKVYLCSIKAALADLKVVNAPVMNEINVESYCLYSIIKLNWHLKLSVFHKDNILELPDIAYIPLYHKRKLARIIKGTCAIRILIGDDVYHELFQFSHVATNVKGMLYHDTV